MKNKTKEKKLVKKLKGKKMSPAQKKNIQKMIDSITNGGSGFVYVYTETDSGGGFLANPRGFANNVNITRVLATFIRMCNATPDMIMEASMISRAGMQKLNKDENK